MFCFLERFARAALHAELEDLAPQLGEQCDRRVERDDAACVHDRDPVAEPFRLVQVMRRQEHGHLPPRSQPGDHVEELGADPRVESHRRLVEEEHARIRDERAGDLEPPALAAAVRADGTIDELREAEYGGELVDARLRLAPVDFPEARVDVEVAPTGQRAVDDGLLEDDAAQAPSRERMLRDVEAGEPGRAARRRDCRRQHPDRRRFAGAVRAQQAEDLAGRDVEVDAFDRLDAARVELAEIVHFDHFVPPVTVVMSRSSER